MNTQSRLKVEKEFNETLSVKEVFYTLQGEGPFSGMPALFIRLAGCNLICQRCDTDYSVQYVWSVENVIKHVQHVLSKESNPYKDQLCVVTGGEPFRQNRMPDLVIELLKVFKMVQLETSGSCWQPGFAYVKSTYFLRVMTVCSPKTPRLHPKIIPFIDAYKYVVRNGYIDEDGLPGEEAQLGLPKAVAKPHDLSIPVYISPWDEYDEKKNLANTQAAVQVCLQYGYRLSLQVHKIVDLP